MHKFHKKKKKTSLQLLNPALYFNLLLLLHGRF